MQAQDRTSSEEWSFVHRADKLTKLCELQEDDVFKEYRLTAEPDSFDALLSVLYDGTSKENNPICYIWINEKAFIRTEGGHSMLPEMFCRCDFFARFERKGRRHDMLHDTDSDPSLFVWGETREEARLCLQFLIDLVVDRDSSYQMYQCHDETNGPGYGFPLTSRVYKEKFFLGSSTFLYMDFSLEYSQILAINNKSCLYLGECGFEDRGDTYVSERLRLRTSGVVAPTPARYAIDSRIIFPFDPRNWERFLSTLTESDTVELSCQEFTDETIKVPKIAELVLRGSMFDDGTSLTTAINANEGPRYLDISSYPDPHVRASASFFKTSEQFCSFARALQNNVRLKTLRINLDHRLNRPVTIELARSLRINSSLIALSITIVPMAVGSDWLGLFPALTSRSSIQEIRVRLCSVEGGTIRGRLSRQFWDSVKGMLRSNKNIETLSVSLSHPKDEQKWSQEILPFLDLNKFRKKYQGANRWPGIAGNVMGLVSGKPWLLWFVMKQNQSVMMSSISGRPNRQQMGNS